MIASTAQYNRLHLHCGASRLELFRAAHKMLTKRGRSREQREVRHKWMRSIAQRHDEAFVLYLAVNSGKI